MGCKTAAEPITRQARNVQATAVAVGAIVVYGFLVLGGALDPSVRAHVGNAGSAVAALVVAGLALLTARVHRTLRFRASWVLLGAGLLALAAVVAWSFALQRGGTPGWVAEAALGLAWLLLLVWMYTGFQGAAEDHRRERQLRVGHASSFRREQHRLRQLQAVRDVTMELTRELDLTSLLSLITRRSAELVNAPMGVAFLWDDLDGVLVPRAWHGLGSWFSTLRLRRGEGAAGRAIELGRGVIVNDYASSREAFLPLLTRAQVSAALATPVVSNGQLVVVIVVADERVGRTFEAADLTLLELFADQAAVAIEHARLVDEAASVEALRELARLKTELLSTVSHELRTPATLIHGYAELLNARADLLTPEDVAMMADEILLGSRTMIRLVDDLLDFSRRDSLRLQLERTRVDISDLLRRHVHAWRGQAGCQPLHRASRSSPSIRSRSCMLYRRSGRVWYTPDALRRGVTDGLTGRRLSQHAGDDPGSADEHCSSSQTFGPKSCRSIRADGAGLVGRGFFRIRPRSRRTFGEPRSCWPSCSLSY